MQLSEFVDCDAVGLAELVAKGEVSPDELLAAALEGVEQVNGALNAVVRIDEGFARAAMARAPAEGVLRGVPFLLKDLGAEAVGLAANCGSRFFADLETPRSSTFYDRLAKTGVVCFGRTASPELGIGPATEAQVYGGPTRNPWNREHTSGGSSGGAGAAVAAGIVPAAHGSDGGGSVRIPASSCGLFGHKPSRGLMPQGPDSGEGWGGMSTDGFLTRSVRDTALLLDAVVGPEVGAPYHGPFPDEAYTTLIERPPARLRIAYSLRSFTGAELHGETRAAVEKAAKLCGELGHEVLERDLEIDLLALMGDWAKIVACGTALAVKSRARSLGRAPLADELEPVTHGAMAYSATISGEDYLAALSHMHAVGRQVSRFLEDVDVLLTPTLAEPPAKVGRFKPDNPDFVDYRLGPHGIVHYSPFPPVFNASGHPAMSVPLHWSADGLPVGVQFAGVFGSDGTLMQLARQLEEAAPWFTKRPDVSVG